MDEVDLARLSLEKKFSKQKMKLYTAQMITCGVQDCVQ